MNVCCDAETESLGIATTISDFPVNEATSSFYGFGVAFFVYFCIIYDFFLIWLRGHDLNVRPSGYEPDELPEQVIDKTAKILLSVNLWAGNWAEMRSHFSTIVTTTRDDPSLAQFFRARLYTE